MNAVAWISIVAGAWTIIIATAVLLLVRRRVYQDRVRAAHLDKNARYRAAWSNEREVMSHGFYDVTL